MRKRDAIRKMRAILLRRRSAILQSLDLTRSQLQNRQDRDVGDTVDFALDAEYQEISSQLAAVEGSELAQINIALEQMATGEYGVCEDCGRTIPLARLQALPYATVCIRCQHDREAFTPESESTLWAGSSENDFLLNGNGVGVA